MADQISNIVDVNGILADLQKVTDKIVNLETTIDEANQKTLTVKVDAGSVDTLAQINAGILKLNEATAQNTAILNENKNVVAQQTEIQAKSDGIAEKNIGTLVDQRMELAAVQRELLALKKAMTENDTIADGWIERLERLTQNELDLKIAISNTTSAIKSSIKESQAASGSMDELSQKLFQMKERYRAMSSEMRVSKVGEELKNDIQKADAEIKELDKTLGNSQRNVGNYEKGVAVLGMTSQQAGTRLATMAFRLAAFNLLFTPIITGVTSLATSFMSLIPGTDAYLENAKKMADANTKLIGSFDGIVDTLEKIKKELYALSILSNNNEAGRNAIQEETVEGYKRRLELLQATGVLNGEVYTHEKELIKEANDVRGKEIEQLEKRQELIDQINSFRIRAQGGSKPISEYLSESGLPKEEQKRLKLEFDEAVKNGGNIEDALEKLRLKTAADTVENDEKIRQKKADIKNAEIEFEKRKERELQDFIKKMNAEHLVNKENLYQQQLALRNKDLDSIRLSVDEETKLRLKQLSNEKQEARKNFAEKGQPLPIGLAEQFSQRKTDIEKEQQLKQLAQTKDYYTQRGLQMEIDAENVKSYHDSIIKLNDDIDKIIADRKTQDQINQTKYKGAGNVNPINEILGIKDDGFGEEQKILQIKIDAKKAEIKKIEQEAQQKKDDGIYNITDELETEKTVNSKLDELDQLKWDKKISDAEHTAEIERDILRKSVDFAKEAYDAIRTIQNNAFAAEQQQLQIEQQKLERTSQQKIAAINATAGYQIAKDNEVAKVVAQTTAQQNAIQQKQNELALKKAKADKEASESGIILNTALAVSKLLPLYAVNPILAAAETALVISIGAAQYAAAASTPLPQFFKGGTTETPIFRAGEQGRELGITPSGEAMLFNTDAIYSAPIGTEIKNNADTERIINYAVNNTGKLVAYEAPPMTDKNIIEELKENRKTMIEIAMLKQPIKPTVIVNNGYNPLQRPRK